MDSTPTETREAFLQEVQEFRRKRVSRLRNINHWWNISLTVTGITLTAVTTILGVINNENYKDWIKFGIAFSGATAVLSQSANKEFQVKGKAGKYAKIEAELLVIEYKLKNKDNDEKLKDLYENFYTIINDIGNIEYEIEKDRV